MYQIDKVEAVNRILKPLSGTKVVDLDEAQNDEVLGAIDALNTTVEKVQWENEWNFNSDGPRTLAQNGDGEIEIPLSYAFIKILQWSNGHVSNLTIKGNKIFNLRENTSIVEGTVQIHGTVMFSYDDMAGAIQNYVIEKAKYHYVGNNPHFSASRLQLTAQDMRDAFQAATKFDSEMRFGRMDNSPSQRQVFRQRGNFDWWSGG